MERELGRRKGIAACAARQSALREHLDVPGLVVHVAREPLQDLGIARIHLGQEPGRHVERGVLVLGDVGHDLGDRRLDMIRQPGGRLPGDVGRAHPIASGWRARRATSCGSPQAVALVEAPRRTADCRASASEPRGASPPLSGAWSGGGSMRRSAVEIERRSGWRAARQRRRENVGVAAPPDADDEARPCRRSRRPRARVPRRGPSRRARTRPRATRSRPRARRPARRSGAQPGRASRARRRARACRRRPGGVIHR